MWSEVNLMYQVICQIIDRILSNRIFDIDFILLVVLSFLNSEDNPIQAQNRVNLHIIRISSTFY
jgi:hypothetical protein